MNISIHFITSIVLAALLWPFFGFYSLWAIVGGYLIDFDHYLYAGFKWKLWNLKKSYKMHLNKEYRKKIRWGEILHIFHTIEFWIFMIVMAYLSYRNNWTFLFHMFTLTFAGMILHLLLDTTDGMQKKELGIRAISLVQWWNAFGRHKN